MEWRWDVERWILTSVPKEGRWAEFRGLERRRKVGGYLGIPKRSIRTLPSASGASLADEIRNPVVPVS